MTRFDIDSQHYDPEWDMGDSAGWHLFPIHLFNSVSAGMSLFGFWVWLFFSPHYNEVGRDLDRTRTKLEFPSSLNKSVPPLQTLPPPPPPLTISVGLFFFTSWQLCCRTMASEPRRCCISIGAELHSIRDGKDGSLPLESSRVVWPVCHRDEPSVPPLPRRNGAGHDQNVRYSRICRPSFNQVFLICFCPPCLYF